MADGTRESTNQLTGRGAFCSPTPRENSRKRRRSGRSGLPAAGVSGRRSVAPGRWCNRARKAATLLTDCIALDMVVFQMRKRRTEVPAMDYQPAKAELEEPIVIDRGGLSVDEAAR